MNKNQSYKKTFFRNLSALTSVQIANYVLPLITLPYLARVIGVEKFGAISFAQSIVIYFVMFTTFGFNLYAPREISVVAGDKKKLQETFWEIIYARSFLCIVSLLLYSGIIFTCPKFMKDLWIFIFAFGLVIGDILFPMWFFQGIEKMTYIAVFNFMAKILYSISIFVFIKEKSQYIYVPLLISVSQVISGLVSMLTIIFSFKIYPVFPRLRNIFQILKNSFVLFMSSISINIYTKINPVLLGFFCGDIFVGYYSAAERLFQAWMGIQGQIGFTLYPYISKIAQERNLEQTLGFIRKALFITMSAAIPAALFLFILAGPIINIFFGREFMQSVIVLQILSFLCIIIGLSNVFGIQTMLPFNMNKEFLIPILTAGILNLILGFALIPVYKHIGASLSFLISEIWVTLSMFLILRIKGIRIFNNYYILNEARQLITNLWRQ